MNAPIRETDDGIPDAHIYRKTGQERLPKTGGLNSADLRSVANKIFGNRIDWESEDSGFMECPGSHNHTSPNTPKECRIKIDQGRPPTINCFHNSCKVEIDSANKRLRSAIGQATWTGKPSKPKTQGVPHEQQDEPLVCKVSPVPLPTDAIPHSTVAFLKTLFQPEELVAIYDCRESDRKTGPDGRIKYSPGAGTTRRVSDLINAIEAAGSIAKVYTTGLTLFIRANPMKSNGRGDSDVTAYRYVLVDIDKDEDGAPYPLEVQYGALIASGLPVASVTYSGDISLAALIKVDAPNHEAFKACKEEIYTQMARFIKIDESCGNPSRWTRCPDGLRHIQSEEEPHLKREQRLIALNIGPSSWEEYQRKRQHERLETAAARTIQLAADTDDGPRNRPAVLALNTFANLHAEYGIEYSGNKPVVNLAVIKRVLKSHPEWAGKIWSDSFLKRILTSRSEQNPPEWTDINDSDALIWLQESFGLPNAKIEDVRRAVPVIAHENQTNCLQEWLSSLNWDTQPRLSHLLSTGFGAEVSEYHSRVGECWLISMIARAMKPGCKVDTLPVFEGEQGAYKSSGLGILGGELFTECHEQITSKDFYSVLAGRWLVEISEMHSFSKAEVNRIKGIISNQSDRYRVPYDRYSSDHPRQSVFAGTTNRDDWHNDDTGGRRFWPVACGVVNLQWLQENREQLFAEAVVRYQNGESWWDVPTDEHRRKIDDRRQEDPWTDAVLTYMEDHAPCSMAAILQSGVGRQTESQTSGDQRRCASILKQYGYEKYYDNSDGKRRKWRKKGTR